MKKFVRCGTARAIAVCCLAALVHSCGSDKGNGPIPVPTILGTWEITSHKIAGSEVPQELSRVGEMYRLETDSTGRWKDKTKTWQTYFTWSADEDSLHIKYGLLVEPYQFSLTSSGALKLNTMDATGQIPTSLTLSPAEDEWIVDSVFVVKEDFELYPPNTFPSTGGWQLLHNGAGTQYQVVTDVTANSGSKCMQMKGRWNWAADVYQDFDIPPQVMVMFFEFWLKTPPTRGIPHDDCGLNATYVAMGHDNNTGYLNGDMMLAQANTWYKLKMKIDARSKTADFWINDTLVAEGRPWTGTFDGFSRVTMHAGWGDSVFFFDDVRVWYEGE